MYLYFCFYKPAKWSVIKCLRLHYLFAMLNDGLSYLRWSQTDESDCYFIMDAQTRAATVMLPSPWYYVL